MLLKMVAVHSPLYKVSFHGGGASREAGLLTGVPTTPNPGYIPVVVGAEIRIDVTANSQM